jgi:L,D-transpeptidase ErfK/SrfK
MNKWLCAWILCFAGLRTCAWATMYELPADGSDVIGTDERTRSTYQDTLLDIARRYSVGFEEIIRANPGVDIWMPGAGTNIVLPGRHILPPGPLEGIVVNLPEHRLYYYPKPKKGAKPVVLTYPVSVGSLSWRSPLGETRIVAKEKHPNWYPTEAVRKEHMAAGDPLPKVVPPGPNNPLGEFKMRLAAGGGTYEIHGTNNPIAVGMAITHGCITMYPEDVAALFQWVPVGTKVSVINDPIKVTYVGGDVLLEAHPTVDSEGSSVEPDLELLSEQLERALGSNSVAIHWDFARDALYAATGILTVVGLEANAPIRVPASVGVATVTHTQPTSLAPGRRPD